MSLVDEVALPRVALGLALVVAGVQVQCSWVLIHLAFLLGR